MGGAAAGASERAAVRAGGAALGRRAEVALLVLVLAAGAGLRFGWLDAKSVWYDEAVGYFIAVRPLPELLAAVRNDVHPPLGYLVAHAWPFLSAGDFGLRAPAALCGSAAILVAYLAGRLIGGGLVGLLAAAFTALNPLQVALSQEARMYGLLSLLAAASLLLLEWALERPGATAVAPGRALRWAAFGLVTGLALLTHYYAVFLVVAEGGYVLLRQAVAGRLEPGPYAGLALAGLVFLPWLPSFLAQAGGVRAGYWIGPPGENAAWETFKALLAFSAPNGPPLALEALRVGRWAALALAALAVLAGLRALRRPGGSGAGSLLAALVVAVPTLGALAVSTWLFPIFVLRYVGFTVPALGILLACGVRALPGVPLRAAGAALALAPLLLALPPLFADPAYDRSDLRAAAALVRSEYRPGDLVLHTGQSTEAPFAYYLGPSVAAALVEDATPATVAELARRHARLWYVRGHALDDRERQEAEQEADRLLAGLGRVERWSFPGVLVYRVEP